MCAPYNAVRRGPRYIRAWPRLARPGWPIFAGSVVLPVWDGWDYGFASYSAATNTAAGSTATLRPPHITARGFALEARARDSATRLMEAGGLVAARNPGSTCR